MHILIAAFARHEWLQNWLMISAGLLRLYVASPPEILPSYDNAICDMRGIVKWSCRVFIKYTILKVCPETQVEYSNMVCFVFCFLPSIEKTYASLTRP